MLVMERESTGLVDGVDEAWRPRWFLKALLVVVAIGAVFVVAFRALVGADDAEDRDALQECFDLAVTGDFNSIVPAPCDGPHEYTLLARVTHPAGELGVYPDATDLDLTARSLCADAIAASTGLTSSSLVEQLVMVPPSVEAWIDGDRSIGCVVGAEASAGGFAGIEGSTR